jgi:hypothetical protein
MQYLAELLEGVVEVIQLGRQRVARRQAAVGIVTEERAVQVLDFREGEHQQVRHLRRALSASSAPQTISIVIFSPPLLSFFSLYHHPQSSEAPS